MSLAPSPPAIGVVSIDLLDHVSEIQHGVQKSSTGVEVEEPSHEFQFVGSAEFEAALRLSRQLDQNSGEAPERPHQEPPLESTKHKTGSGISEQQPIPPIIEISVEIPVINTSRFSMDSIASRDFAVNQSRWSVLSTDSVDSTLSATNFDFDQEALKSSSYRQAFGERVRGLISRPIRSSGDNALLRAVEPLESEQRYHEQNMSMEWEFSITGDTIRSDDTWSDTASLRTTDSHLTANELFPQRISITEPFNLQHIQHIGLDPVTGDFVGLPPEWKKILNAEAERGRAQVVDALTETIPEVPLSSEPKPASTIKLVVVGDYGKIKQGLLITYVTNKFPSEYTPTVFDNYAVSLMIANEPYTLGLFNTTGQESYDRLRPLAYPQTDVFIIVVSVGNTEHYKNAHDIWAPELKHHCPGAPFLLVGIKDGAIFEAEMDDRVFSERRRISVDTKAGQTLADAIGAEKYVECELYTMNGVKNVFDEAIVAALQPPSLPKKRRRSRLNLRLLSRIEED